MAHHGNTPAAWTGVVVILVGFVVGGIGLVLDNWVMFWVGVVIGLLGPVAGKIMAMVGLGAAPLNNSDH